MPSYKKILRDYLGISKNSVVFLNDGFPQYDMYVVHIYHQSLMTIMMLIISVRRTWGCWW